MHVPACSYFMMFLLLLLLVGAVDAFVHNGAITEKAFVSKIILSNSAGFDDVKEVQLEGQDIQLLSEPNDVLGRVFESDKRPVILFDGICNMCSDAVNIAIDWDPKGVLRYAALQSNVGRALLQANGREADDISSIVLVTEEKAYIKSDAILRIAEELVPIQFFLFSPFKPTMRLARLVVPKLLRDVFYDGVADNRYRVFGKRDQCRIDSDGEFENRFVDEALATKLM